MRGLKLDVLLSLLDFLYLGESNIWQEKLDEFLALAAELKLKGLGGDEEQENEGNPSKPKTSRIKSEKETQPTEAISGIETSIQTQLDTYTYPNTEVEMAQHENNEDMEAQIRSMISGSEETLRSAGISGSGKVHTCKVCGKRGESSNIKKHIKNNHIARVAQCNICGQIASSRKSLGNHMFHKHKKQQIMCK